MIESLLVERWGSILSVTPEGDEEDPNPKPHIHRGTDDQLHEELCRLGYLRVGPARDGDPIAGMYVRKVAHG